MLRRLNSNIDIDDENNWIRVLIRKKTTLAHPIRHILLITFLCGDLAEFFEVKESYSYFGKGPWPCLNPVADHYRKDVIRDIIITTDSKTKQPVGTFYCSCGFVYSRRGPDRVESDRYKIGTIKTLGSVWEDKLKQIITMSPNSLRKLAQRMGCDPKTIVKYAFRMGLKDYLHSSMNIEYEKRTHIDDISNIEMVYKHNVVDYIEQEPECSRKDVATHLKKEFSWLYRHDKQWLYENLPPSHHHCNGNEVNKVDWCKKDCMVLEAVQRAYKKIVQSKKPVRVTQSIIGRISGMSALLDHHINKMPNTKAYLESVVETVEEFQRRRIKYVCDRLYAQNGSLRKWEIIRQSGLRPEYVSIQDAYINEIMREYA